jgi:hypothetical protein
LFLFTPLGSIAWIVSKTSIDSSLKGKAKALATASLIGIFALKKLSSHQVNLENDKSTPKYSPLKFKKLDIPKILFPSPIPTSSREFCSDKLQKELI